jgi:hypothetical protein
MPFDSNGVFSRVMNWTSDQQNGIAIECGRHDAEDDNFAQGFNDCFCRDGRAAATGDFNLGNYKLKNLAAGIATTDAVNKGQLDEKANTTDVVNLTGMQTITGNKTHTGQVNFANSTWNAIGDDAFFGDRNIAGAVCFKGNNGNTAIRLSNRSETVGNGFYIDENDLNALKIIAPTQGANAFDSVTAMTARNVAMNGYIKFDHGLILAKGRAQLNFESTNIISLPYPMPNANYIVASSYCADTNYGRQDPLIIFDKTTTSFTVKNNAGSGHGNIFIDYIVITIE